MAIDIQAITGDNVQDKKDMDIFKLISLARSHRQQELYEDRIEKAEADSYAKSFSTLLGGMLKNVTSKSSDQEIENVSNYIDEHRDNELLNKSPIGDAILGATDVHLKNITSSKERNKAISQDLQSLSIGLKKVWDDQSKEGLYDNEGLMDFQSDVVGHFNKHAPEIDAYQKKYYDSYIDQIMDAQTINKRLQYYDKDPNDLLMQFYDNTDVAEDQSKKGRVLNPIQKEIVYLAQAAAAAGDYSEANAVMDKLSSQYAIDNSGSMSLHEVIQESNENVAHSFNNGMSNISWDPGWSDEYEDKLQYINKFEKLNAPNASVADISSRLELLGEMIAGTINWGNTDYVLVNDPKLHRQQIHQFVENNYDAEAGELSLHKMHNDLDLHQWGLGNSAGTSATEHMQLKNLIDLYMNIDSYIINAAYISNKPIIDGQGKSVNGNGEVNFGDMNNLEKALLIADTGGNKELIEVINKQGEVSEIEEEIKELTDTINTQNSALTLGFNVNEDEILKLTTDLLKANSSLDTLNKDIEALKTKAQPELQEAELNALVDDLLEEYGMPKTEENIMIAKKHIAGEPRRGGGIMKFGKPGYFRPPFSRVKIPE